MITLCQPGADATLLRTQWEYAIENLFGWRGLAEYGGNAVQIPLGTDDIGRGRRAAGRGPNG